eukprot:scaffold7342_cov269-Pinguiococcus_pyrenoidosus.AAC.4
MPEGLPAPSPQWLWVGGRAHCRLKRGCAGKIGTRWRLAASAGDFGTMIGSRCHCCPAQDGLGSAARRCRTVLRTDDSYTGSRSLVGADVTWHRAEMPTCCLPDRGAPSSAGDGQCRPQPQGRRSGVPECGDFDMPL